MKELDWEEIYEEFKTYVSNNSVNYEVYNFKEWLKERYILIKKESIL